MTSYNARLARLRAECEVAAAPWGVLAVACVVLALFLGLDALLGQDAPAEAEVATPHAASDQSSIGRHEPPVR